MFTLENQFKKFIENQLTNPFIEADEREVPFNSYDEVYQMEDDIFIVAIDGNEKHLFEYNTYSITNEGTSLFEFEYFGKK